MSALKKNLSAKTDHELLFYVQNVGKHTEEAVRLALAELQNRNVTLPEGLALEVENQLAANKMKKEKEELPAWKQNVVLDPDASMYYSKTAIYIFSILFSVFFGSFMLAANCKDAGKPRWPVVLFGLLYSLFTLSISEYINLSGAYTYIIAAFGTLMMYEFFWGRYIGNDSKFRKKPIWKPLIIAAVIFIPLLVLIYHGRI